MSVSDMARYRQAQLKTGDELGYEYYQLVGPDDYRNCEICNEALNIISTKKEWLRLYPKIFTLGLHKTCRCQLVPVTLSDGSNHYDVKIGNMTMTAYKELEGEALIEHKQKLDKLIEQFEKENK